MGNSIGTFVLDAFLPWVVGEIVPFGDLVTNVWLWSILPTTRPAEYGCSDDTYTVRGRHRIMTGAFRGC